MDDEGSGPSAAHARLASGAEAPVTNAHLDAAAIASHTSAVET